MNPLDAIEFFNSAHVLISHTDTGPLRAYATWIEERYLEAPTYLELGVKAKERHDALVLAGKLSGSIKLPKEPYADVAGIMAVQWKKEQAPSVGAHEGPDKTAQFKAAL